MIGEFRKKIQRNNIDAPTASFLEQLERFGNSIQAAESATSSDDESQSLKEVLRAASDLVASSETLFQRLHSLGLSTVTQQSREIREIQALGNYWRICKYFVKVSGRYRDHFRLMELMVLEKGAVKRWDRLKQYVHAEIQLLVHFEISSADRPKFIGSSKKPCFLCYSFVRAHATYNVCRSHGEVFKQWTIP